MRYDVDFDSKIDMDKKGNTLSSEELAEKLASGEGSLSQVKEDSDGNKRFFNVYGPVPDGLDHFMNVFLDSSCISTIWSAASDGNLKKPDNDESDDQYDGWQMTVDYTDEAIMWIIRSEKDKVCLEAYQRDERKGFSFPAISGEWETKDGSLEITTEKIEEDNNLIYLGAFAVLRKHLIAEGVLDKLRELKKYAAAGVMITAEDENHISYKIVQDKGRPELPCDVFLMGTITCRPYLDELIMGSQMSDKSIEEQTELAEKGDVYAIEALAKAYTDGDEVAQDYKQALGWWEKLGDYDNAAAQFNAGRFYAKGAGVKRDFAKAAEWMQKAADNGDKDAAAQVDLYKNAQNNLEKAIAGDAAAQAELSQLYMLLGNSMDLSDTSTEDYREAFKWAKKAADQDNPDGLYQLGLCYEHGRGTKEDSEEAAKAYQKASDQGHAPSQWNLACMLLQGHYGAAGGPFGVWNESDGLILAFKAAEQGYELAINGLEESGNTVDQIIKHYANEERNFMLEGTQYEGRADRCERIHPDDELTYRIVKDRYGFDVLEFFFRGGSVGMLYQYNAAKLIALLKLKKVNLKTTVRSIIPKSRRGKRARNAEVTLNLILTKIDSKQTEKEVIETKEETPEEKEAKRRRIEKEEERKKQKEQDQKKRKEASEETLRELEEIRKQHDSNHVAYADIKQQAEDVRTMLNGSDSEIIRPGFTVTDGWEALDKPATEKEIKEKSEGITKRLEELEKENDDIRKKQTKQIIVRASILCGSALAAILLIVNLLVPFIHYRHAVSIMEKGNWVQAEYEFEKLNGFMDSEEMIEEIHRRQTYMEAEQAFYEKNYEKAEKLFKDLGNYSDAEKRLAEVEKEHNKVLYKEAEESLKKGLYDQALATFQKLGSYSDAPKRVEEVKEAKNKATYAEAEEELKKQHFTKAKTLFQGLGDYSNSKQRVKDVEKAEAAYKKKQEEEKARKAAEKAKNAVRDAWSLPLNFPSSAGGYYIFTFNWADGATQPAVHFEDSDGNHALSVREISATRMVLYDSRGVTHTLTYNESSESYNWRWESSNGLNFR